MLNNLHLESRFGSFKRTGANEYSSPNGLMVRINKVASSIYAKVFLKDGTLVHHYSNPIKSASALLNELDNLAIEYDFNLSKEEIQSKYGRKLMDEFYKIGRIIKKV